MQADSVEDMAVRTLMCEKLRVCIEQLSQSEQDLIFALYFEGKSEREYSTKTGISNMTIHDRKMHILKKLKLLMETQIVIRTPERGAAPEKCRPSSSCARHGR
jgi:DNA-directed RNA polymerase specialized sigma24 family protein